MKHNAKKSDSETFKGNAIVAFFDLLGFSKSIFQDWGDFENDPVNRLLRIKAAPGIGTSGITFQAHEGEGGKPIGPRYRPMVNSVSDSFSLTIGLPAQANASDMFLAFHSVFANAKFVWQAAVREGFVVRGGIELGQIYRSPTEIIGPAFINAYIIESKISKTARIFCWRFR